jgi:Kdo2-lipid IVA lauroyltransferase/acyltransferase
VGLAVRPILKRVKNDVIFVAVKIIMTVHRLLPRCLGLKVFESIGRIAFCFPNRERTQTIDHLRMIFGNSWRPSAVRRCARSVYGNLGKNAFDALYLSRIKKERFLKYVRSDDLAEIRQAYERGRGVMVVTAHCGCFEMLLHFFAMQGFPCFAIGSRLYDKRLDDLVSKLRSGENMVYLHRSENLRTMLKFLKAGRVMGVLIDQDTSVEGVFAHFLGKLAYTPSGVIKLARRYGIPVFAVTTARESDETHRVFISREIDLTATGREMEDCVRGIETINAHISETIKRYPSQWVWMHRRWSKRSGDEAYRNVPNIEQYVTVTPSPGERKGL